MSQSGIAFSGVATFSALTATPAMVSGHYVVPTTSAVNNVRMQCVTGPVGSALVIVLQRSPDQGNTWTPIATLTIADGATADDVQNISQPLTAGDWLRVSVTSVGTTTAATGVTVTASIGVTP